MPSPYWFVPRSTFLTLALAELLLTRHGPQIAEATLLNVTVDDDGTDSLSGAVISYAPEDQWKEGKTCTGCLAHPDPSLALDGTWHDSTFGGVSVNTTYNATFRFTGWLSGLFTLRLAVLPWLI